jgi:Rieske 2Fe-2S family protein
VTDSDPSPDTPRPLTHAEIAATRRPFRAARLLPPRVFHDPDILAFEQEHWFGRDWLCVGREDDAANSGEYFLATVAGESLIVVRAPDARLRAFYNVCRHRGSQILEEPAGRVVRFQCPYHAWVYDLDGRLARAAQTDDLVDFEPAENSLVPARCETWQGFVFVSLDPAAAPLRDHLRDLPGHFERFDLASLRRARRITYEVAANWKAIGENYSECYHCPGVHPQLNRLTPYDVGRDFLSDGPWKGGYMELVERAETMSVDGLAHGRPPIAGMTADDRRRIYYYIVWPNLLISLHPDYLMTHQVWPLEPGRSRVHCDWFFEPATMADPAFDPSGVIDFWDLTNRQDWHVCELQQRGTASRAYTSGRYSGIEDAVHAFDLMCADRYAADGVRTVRGSRHGDGDHSRDGLVGLDEASAGRTEVRSASSPGAAPRRPAVPGRPSRRSRSAKA